MNITGPVILRITPDTLNAIFDALSELPYKKANPAIIEIAQQLQSFEKTHAKPELEPEKVASSGMLPHD